MKEMKSMAESNMPLNLEHLDVKSSAEMGMDSKMKMMAATSQVDRTNESVAFNSTNEPKMSTASMQFKTTMNFGDLGS